MRRLTRTPDCVAGSALGMAITWVQWHFNDAIERFQILDDFTVPLVTIPMGLLMVSVHPQPLDDCPCFEDGEVRLHSRGGLG